MTERERSALRWRRRAAEVVTIVAGILLALAADAGRQYLADRRTEREILAALRVEFSADVREIETDQQHRARKLAAIELLDEVRGGMMEAQPPDSLVAALLRAMDWRYYTPSHPVLDDLLSTGRLDLIRSDDLRRALMIFGQERARIAVIEEQERSFVAREVEPYLAKRLDLGALATQGSPEQHAVAVRALSDVLKEATFGSLLYLDRERTKSSTGFATGLLAAVSAVQEALGEPG